VRNSSLVERQGIDNERASNIVPKLKICSNASGRRAFQQRRSCGASHGGAVGKANVGISNDKADEKSAHRKTKVS
jgi:hypothetical protein